MSDLPNLDNPHLEEPPRESSISPFILANMQNTARLIGIMGSEGMKLDIQEESESGKIGDSTVTSLKVSGKSILETEGLFATTSSTGVVIISGQKVDYGVSSSVVSIHDIPSSQPLLMVVDTVGKGAYQVQTVRPKNLSYEQLVELYRSGQHIPRDEIAHFELVKTEESVIIWRKTSDDHYEYFNAKEGDVIPQMNEVADAIVSPIDKVIEQILQAKGYTVT